MHTNKLLNDVYDLFVFFKQGYGFYLVKEEVIVNENKLADAILKSFECIEECTFDGDKITKEEYEQIFLETVRVAIKAKLGDSIIAPDELVYFLAKQELNKTDKTYSSITEIEQKVLSVKSEDLRLKVKEALNGTHFWRGNHKIKNLIFNGELFQHKFGFVIEWFDKEKNLLAEKQLLVVEEPKPNDQCYNTKMRFYKRMGSVFYHIACNPNRSFLYQIEDEYGKDANIMFRITFPEY